MKVLWLYCLARAQLYIGALQEMWDLPSGQMPFIYWKVHLPVAELWKLGMLACFFEKWWGCRERMQLSKALCNVEING